MALNLNLLRKKLEKLETSSGTQRKERDPRLWMPKPGDNKIRIIPLAEHPDDPFIKLNFHYKVCPGGKVSLASFGEKDPIIDYAKNLIEQGNALTFANGATEADKKKGKDMYFKGRTMLGGKTNASRGETTPRYHCLIVDRDNENSDLQFWAHGEKIFTNIVKAALNLQSTLVEFDKLAEGEEVDFTDPVKGHDLIVTYYPSIKQKDRVLKDYPDYKGKFNDSDYAETEVKFENKSSVLTEDKELARKIMEEQLNIFDIFSRPTYEELQKDLEKYLQRIEQEQNRDTSESKEVNYKTSRTESTSTEKTEKDFEQAIESETKDESINEVFPEENKEESEAVQAAKDKFDQLFS